MKKYLIIFLIFNFLTISLAFAEYVIVVNPNNPISEISRKDLKNIYRMKKINWGGGLAIDPVNLKVNNEARIDFSHKILGKKPKTMKIYYFKRALSGKGQPPVIFKKEIDVIDYVSSNKGAIGYVSDADGSVKIIAVK